MIGNETILSESAANLVSTLGLSAPALARIAGAAAAGQALASIGLLVLWLMFPLSAYQPGASDYQALKDVNWSQRAQLPAGLIFTPSSAQDLAKAMPVVFTFSIPFAVRSGGHTPHAGPASTSGGLLIALDRLTQLSLSADGSLAYVGPGNRWGQVYKFLQPHDKLVVGGRMSAVGVGGLTTGGGNSYLSNLHGLACDNVDSFEVVLASGRIVTASALQNPDLFRALKGGGGNFGIITRLTLPTVPSRGVWGGNAIYSPDKYPALIRELVRYQSGGQAADPNASMVQNVMVSGSGSEAWFSMLFHAQPLADYPPSLAPWKALAPIVDTTRQRPSLFDLTLDTADLGPPVRHDFRTLSIGVSEELYTEMVALFRKTYAAITHVSALQVTLTMQLMGLRTVEEGERRGGNVLDLPKVPHTWLCLTPTWSDAADDAVVLDTGRAFLDAVAALARERGLLYRYLFLNDGAADQQVMASYGPSQMRFMEAVSRRYDPAGVFQELRTAPDGYKLKPGKIRAVL